MVSGTLINHAKTGLLILSSFASKLSSQPPTNCALRSLFPKVVHLMGGGCAGNVARIYNTFPSVFGTCFISSKSSIKVMHVDDPKLPISLLDLVFICAEEHY